MIFSLPAKNLLIECFKIIKENFAVFHLEQGVATPCFFLKINFTMIKQLHEAFPLKQLHPHQTHVFRT